MVGTHYSVDELHDLAMYADGPLALYKLVLENVLKLEGLVCAVIMCGGNGGSKSVDNTGCRISRKTGTGWENG